MSKAAKATAPARQQPTIGRFRSQHLAVARQQIAIGLGRTSVMVDEAESPLAWLARRRGRYGQPLIEPHQLLAGERLRIDFTQAHLMPRTTSDWSSPMESGRRGAADACAAADVTVAARQRVHRALDTVGPEFSGLLLDVCCFLKRLEDVERERIWPARSAKVVLQLGLDRLARYYGYAAQAKGRARGDIRTWVAEDAACSSDET